MSKSVDETSTRRTEALINELLEPKIKRMIEEANKILNKRGVQLGAEVRWFIDKVPTKGDGNEKAPK